jgi:hypothetical protein
MATKRDFTTTYGLQSDKSGAGTNTLVVDSVNDRVGIGGVTSPTVTLQLSTNASISNLNASTNFGTTLGATGTVAQFYHLNGNASYLRIKATRNTAGSDWTTASTKLLQVIDVTEQGYIEFNPNGANSGMAFGTNVTEWARFLQSGNLGIGVTTPSFKADIAGDARITSTNRMRFGGTAGTTNFYIQYNSTANSLDFVAG